MVTLKFQLIKLYSPSFTKVSLSLANVLASAGDTRDAGSVPELGRSPGGGHSNNNSGHTVRTSKWIFPMVITGPDIYLKRENLEENISSQKHWLRVLASEACTLESFATP